MHLYHSEFRYSCLSKYMCKTSIPKFRCHDFVQYSKLCGVHFNVESLSSQLLVLDHALSRTGAISYGGKGLILIQAKNLRSSGLTNILADTPTLP